MNQKKENDDYLVLFQGAKISKREANKAGIALVFGAIGMLVAIFIPVAKTKILDYIIILCFVAFGYFVVGNKMFKR